MATRAEQYRTQQERTGHGGGKRKKAPSPKLGTRPRVSRRTERKATYALEQPPRRGRPSRKSTRAGANRTKPDTNFNLREEMIKGSPESRHTRAQARRSHPRGSGR